jgi:hypothetical protein
MTTENPIEKVVESIEITSEDGMIYWQKVFADGTIGAQERSGISTGDIRRLKILQENLKKEFGRDIIINGSPTQD